MGRHRYRNGIAIGADGQIFEPDRQRRGWWVAALTLLVVLAGAAVVQIVRARPSCAGALKLSVAVAPELQGPVRQSAERWTGGDPQVRGVCVAVNVRAAEPAEVATRLAGEFGLTLPGVAEPEGGEPLPDIWIPDSTAWVTRLTLAGITSLPANSPSVARSPVVVAVPENAAASLSGLTWKDLTKRMTAKPAVKVGVVDPMRDSSGLLGLVTVRATAAGTNPAGTNPASTDPASTDPASTRRALVATTMALGAGRYPDRNKLLAELATTGKPTAGTPAVAMLAESAVLAYNAGKPAVPLTALDIAPGAPSLDYPYVVLPSVTGDARSAADGFLRALGTSAFTDLLVEGGLRSADTAPATTAPATTAPVTAAPATTAPATTAPANPSASTGAPNGAPAAAGTPASDLGRAVNDWIALNLPARMLVVIDVSGSMAETVPTAGGITREAVTVQSARRGISMCDDSFAIGLWTFSTKLDGDHDYKELVPVKPLSENRSRLMSALPAIRPKPGGMTGLYDTILAAYQKMLADWDPTRVNTLIVMTDGKNEDPGGRSMSSLLAEMKNVISKDRPIQVVMMGIGNGVSATELRRIAAPTGGGAFLAPDPSKVGEIFLQIMALRAG